MPDTANDYYDQHQIKDIAKGGLVTETTFNLDSTATSNNQYFILVRFYYSSNEYFDIKSSSSLVTENHQRTDVYLSRHLFVHFVLPFSIKGPPRSPLLLAFLFSVGKSIGSGCFFPDVYPSVNLIGHAAITEMIKLQFTTITDRIQNKIRNGNWFPKFSINRKEQKCLPICLRLLTLLTIIKDRLGV